MHILMKAEGVERVYPQAGYQQRQCMQFIEVADSRFKRFYFVVKNVECERGSSEGIWSILWSKLLGALIRKFCLMYQSDHQTNTGLKSTNHP